MCNRNHGFTGMRTKYTLQNLTILNEFQQKNLHQVLPTTQPIKPHFLSSESNSLLEVFRNPCYLRKYTKRPEVSKCSKILLMPQKAVGRGPETRGAEQAEKRGIRTV